ncbi:MAG TPA: nuclear transport factor 2 family protein [Thermoleophilaceae bacterium]|nr:nuclear transport factor 2 family protein [Thermoleophilaceae bacterium]
MGYDDGIEVVRLFIEALNARDDEALRALVSEDVELRKPKSDQVLRGEGALQALVTAAADLGIVLARAGRETADAEGHRVSVPVVEITASGDRLEATAEFELRDGKIVSFGVAPDQVRGA